MDPSPPSPSPHRGGPSRWAGGIFIAILPLVGAWIGGGKGEPVIGLLAGLAAGVIAALLVWVADRLRGIDG